jgi:membrane fusion protein
MSDSDPSTSSPRPLFRGEALKREARLDAILLEHSVRSWIVTLFATCVVSAVALFLTLGEYTRRARVTGQLVPEGGLVPINAPAAGFLTMVLVNEGDQVKRGDTVAKLAIRRALLDVGDSYSLVGESIRARRENLETGHRSELDMLRSQRSSLQRQVAWANSEIDAARETIDSKRQRLDSSSQKLLRMKELVKDGFVSADQVQQQQATTLEDTSELRDAERVLASLRRQVEQLELSLREIPAREAQLAAMHERAKLDVNLAQIANDSQNEIKVVAPASGIVTTRVANPGLSVTPDTSLITISPADRLLEARMLVPSRSVGLIEVGQRVKMRYPAFPYQKFGQYEGTISNISRSALTENEIRTLTGNASPGPEPLYKVTVTLRDQHVRAYGREAQLRAGMQCEADIFLEHRRLIEWLFEPLYALNQRLET